MRLLHILSRLYLSHELCWRPTTRMIAIFIIMYPITNTVFSLPNLFQLCPEWKHYFCQIAATSPFCSFSLQLSIAWILLTWVTKLQKSWQKETKEGTGDPKIEKTNRRKAKRRVLSKSAQQAPVHYSLMETNAWDREQPPGLQMRALPSSLSLPSSGCALAPAGHPEQQTQPPVALRSSAGWRSWMEGWHQLDAVLVWISPTSLESLAPAEYPAYFIFTSLLNI